MNPITRAIRIQTERTNEMEHSTPLFLTSSFCFDDAEDMRAAFADESNDNIYSRFSNPGVQEFTDKMVALEGAEAGYATATGMAAVFASFMALTPHTPVSAYAAVSLSSSRFMGTCINWVDAPPCKNNTS